MKLRKLLMIACPIALIGILAVGSSVLYRHHVRTEIENSYAAVQQPVPESSEYTEIMVAGVDADSVCYNVTIYEDGCFEGSLSYSVATVESPTGEDNVAVAGVLEDFDSVKSEIDGMLNDNREALRASDMGTYLILSDVTTSEHSDAFKAFLSTLNHPVE